MKKTVVAVLLVASLGLTVLAAAAAAQQAARKAAGPEGVLLRNWNDIGRKIIAMAEDWPADKYNYRPNKQVRTFGQILAHVAEVNYYAINPATGKSTKGLQDDPKGYQTKAQIVAFVKKSFADGAAALKAGGNAGAMAHLGDWVGIIEHSGEHYGNLVTYYRNNGVVPPESRPKSKK
ncbi:MAG TPA: DinB family protein [Candidatus Acidoferrales bacterium]|nr:DinB family protein [Candidatus Acidoferrales bacterium]